MGLGDVLAELGFPDHTTRLAIRRPPLARAVGRDLVGRRRMDRTHTPYASAQYVIEVIGDHEDLWAAGGGSG